MNNSWVRRATARGMLMSCVLLLSIWPAGQIFADQRPEVSLTPQTDSSPDQSDTNIVFTDADLPFSHTMWVANGQIVDSYTERTGELTESSDPVEIRPQGAASPVEVVVTGVEGPTKIFAVCGGELVLSVNAQEGSQTVEAQEGQCEIGVHKVFPGTTPPTFIVREVSVPADDPVVLAIDGDDLHTATTVFRDENGDIMTPESLGQTFRRVHFSRTTGTRGLGLFTNTTSGHPPWQEPDLYFPIYQYDVPDGLDYRLDWEVQSAPNHETRYGFKGRIDTFSADIVFENQADDLAAYTVRHRHPDGTRPVQMTQSLRLAIAQPVGSPHYPFFNRGFDVNTCDTELLLEPPFVQTIYSMADPHADFMQQEDLFETAFDPANSIYAPDEEFPESGGCRDDTRRTFVAAAPPVRRAADGVFRTWRFDVGYGPGVAFGDTLDYGLAPLAFIPRLVDDGGTARVDRAPSVPGFIPSPNPWPLPEGVPAHSFNGPLVYAQLGDTRPVPMSYEVLDSGGTVIASGEDLTEFVKLGSSPLPGSFPATLKAELTDPGVRVGGQAAGVSIVLDYGHNTDDPGPPYVQRLTIEENDRFTSAVSSDEGIVRFALGDDGGIDSVTASVRPAGSEDPWTPLTVIDEAPGEYRADLPALPAGVYALQLIAVDAGGNTGEYVSDPGFEVYENGVFLEFEPWNLDFGVVGLSDTVPARVATLRNTGSTDATGLDFGSPVGGFTADTGDCGTTLPAGSDCQVSVTFTPSEEGVVEAVLEVGTDQGHTGTLILAGEGFERPPQIAFEPDTLSSTLEIDGSENVPLTVTNLGDAALEWALSETSHPGGDTDISHSESDDIGGSPFCRLTESGVSFRNRFLRTFTLSDFDIFGDFDVTGMTFGVESLNVSAEITVNLYLLEGDFVFDNLTLVGSVSEVLSAQSQALVTVPVTGTVPAGSTLVAEIDAPDLLAVEGAFVPGSNDLGESAPSYLASDECEFYEPRSFEDIGVEQTHLVMTVSGSVQPVECELPTWLDVAPTAGSIPGSNEQNVEITFDAAGLQPGEFDHSLCMTSNDAGSPLKTVPVSLNVEGAPVAGVSPPVLEFELPTVDSDSRVLEISNSGNTTLDWYFETVDFAGLQVWQARFEGDGVFNNATDIRASADGSHVFVTGLTLRDGQFQYITIAYDAETGDEVWSTPHVGNGGTLARANSLDLSPDGQRVFVSGFETDSGLNQSVGTLAYDAETGDELWLARYQGAIDDDFSEHVAYSVRVSPDGGRVFIAAVSTGEDTWHDYVTLAYDTATGEELWVSRYDGPVNGVDRPPISRNAMEISPDGTRVFVTGESEGDGTGLDYATVTYDTATGDELWAARYDGPPSGHDSARSLAVSADGNQVFVTGESLGDGTGLDYATVAYNAATGDELWVTRFAGSEGVNDRAQDIAVNPAGDTVYVTGTAASNGREMTTIAYDAASGDELWRMDHQEPGNDNATGRTIGVHPDGTQVYVGGNVIRTQSDRDWAVLAYDAVTGDWLWSERFTDAAPGAGNNFSEALAISPDGSRVFFTGEFEFDAATAAYETGGGCVHPDDVPWLTVSPVAGSTAPGAADAITVGADTSGLSAGEYEVLLCLGTNDPAASLIEIPVQLTVLERGALGVDPANLAFEETAVGQLVSANVVVSSAGDADTAAELVLSQIVLSGNPAFEITGGDCQEGTALAPEQSCTIEVSFAPTSQGIAAGALQISTTDDQLATVGLSGTGPGSEVDPIFNDRFEQ